MPNPIMGVRIPPDVLEDFRNLCGRYNLEASEVVKLFVSNCVREGCLPDSILAPDSNVLSLHERVARLEDAIANLGKLQPRILQAG
jgi:antitoxin component of RelBE/YafQ-DinJ toxin-antitoxin module